MTREMRTLVGFDEAFRRFVVVMFGRGNRYSSLYVGYVWRLYSQHIDELIFQGTPGYDGDLRSWRHREGMEHRLFLMAGDLEADFRDPEVARDRLAGSYAFVGDGKWASSDRARVEFDYDEVWTDFVPPQ